MTAPEQNRAALSPSDLEQIAQIDWDTVSAEVIIGDPALRKALEITADHIDACDQGELPPVLPATEQECIEALAKLIAQARELAKVLKGATASLAVVALACKGGIALCTAGVLYSLLNGGLGIAGSGIGAGLNAVLELCSCDEVVCPPATIWCSEHDLAYTRSTCTFGICGTETSLTDCAPYANIGEGTCKEIGEDDAECVDACADVTCNQRTSPGRLLQAAVHASDTHRNRCLRGDGVNACGIECPDEPRRRTTSSTHNSRGLNKRRDADCSWTAGGDVGGSPVQRSTSDKHSA